MYEGDQLGGFTFSNPVSSYIKKIESDYNKGNITLDQITELRKKYHDANEEMKNEMDRANEMEVKQDNHSKNDLKQDQPLKEASQIWIIAGFVFSILGGYGGLILGSNYAFGRYDGETKTLGWIMMGVGFLMRAISNTAENF